MATTTRVVILEQLSEAFGDWKSLTASAQGNVGKTTLIDSEFANLTEDDDGVQGWVRCTSGSNAGNVRRIKASGGYTASSTTITVNFALSIRTESADTFELHRINPQDKLNAISRAIEQLYPTLYLPIRDTTLVVDDLLSNSNFETFSGGFTSWTAVGSPTVAKEDTIVFEGDVAAKVIASGADGQLTQAPTINQAAMANKTVTFERWVWASAASAARIRIDWGGSAFENSDYHPGDDTWRLLRASGAVPSAATQVKAICEVADGNTAYFDGPGGLRVGPVYKYTIPTSIVIGPHTVELQYDEWQPDGNYYQLSPSANPTPGRLIRLTGMDLLSRPATDAGTTEVNGARVELIVAKAAEILHGMVQRDASESDLARLEQIAARVPALMGRPGIRMTPMAAQMPRHTWHVEEDSSGRYLILDQARG